MKKFLLTLSIALLTIIASAQVSITVNVPTAGGLKSALTAAGIDANTVTSLTVTGNINASDIQFMNAMPLLEAFNLEATTIEGDYYNANKFPDNAFKDNKRIKSIKLPKSITNIGYYAFENCTSLTCTLSIPNTVTEIGCNAFSECTGLTGPLVIPNSVKVIRSNAFYKCKGFTGTLTIPNSVTYLANDVFGRCSGFTGDLIIPNSLTKIDLGTFDGCSGMTGKLVIPSSVTQIGYYAFSLSGFTGDLIIPNSVTTIERFAFSSCKGFASVTLSNALKTIEENAFSGCSGLKGILSIPRSVTSIGVKAFSGCTGLTGNLTIPSSVTIIDKYVFMGCSGFSGLLTIPSSITSIGDYSFSGCTGINKINVGISTPLPITQYTFEAIDKMTCQLIVPIGATTSYRDAYYWKDFANITEQALVIFNPQNGMPVPDCFTLINLKITSPVTSREGYTFAGWYKEAACTNAWNFATDLVAGNMTLYAKWNINSYTINFDSQGGSVVTPISTNYKTTISAPTLPTRTGYTFGGWFKEAGCTNAWNFATDVVTGNTTLYAKWNPITYTATFNSQGGSAVASKATNYNTTITAPSNPTRTGYTFGGWYKEAGCTTPWNFATDVVIANTTLYAKWNINNYTVTFDSQGGSVVASKTTNYNTTITAPSNPTRTGYTFDGWYKEAACTNAWNFATDVVATNTTLYAKWNINSYTVAFDSQLGSAVTSITVNYNTTITAPTNPTRTGYTFSGWFKEAACTNAWNFATDAVTSNTTLYAKWIPIPCTVTFNSQGGNSVASTTVNYNAISTKPNDPTRTGYTFGGWYKEATCTNAWNFTTEVVTTNITLYAKWTINKYTVTFDSQGGSVVASKATNYNTTITAPSNPTRTGYTFGGWYKEAAGANAWNFTSDKVTANTTLYAKWTINTFIITFNTQGGNTIANLTVTYNALVIRPADPTRTGYTFSGWYKEAACTNAWNFTTDKITANTTLYAKWNINSYTVTFNTQGGDIIANINANYNTTITTPVAPTRMGYTFNGWYKETACTNAWNFATDKITANTTLFAKWTINTYTVTFNSNGGTAVANVTAQYNAKISEPQAPTRVGHTFEGWYYNLNDDFPFNFTAYTIKNNTTLIAKWTPITYGVSFYSEGISINWRGVEYNTTISDKPEDPTRTGYIFNGWYKEATFINLWNFATDKVMSTMSLYAKWTALTYKVSYDSQGGTTVPAITVNHGTKISEPTPPTRKGYTLKGWYDQPTNGFTFFFDYTQITADITLYAQWTINRYSITFDSKGGTAVASQTVDYNSPIYAPTPPTRTGYTFDGWFKDEALTSAWNFATDVVSDNATLYANWKEVVYNVIFNSQGGSAVSNVNVNHGKTLTRPADPTRTGYTFAGWYKDANCTTAWNFATDVVTKATTLYAKWNINTYTVSFNAQGGSSIADVTCDYNNTIAEPLAPTRIGYTFAGWYKEYNYITAWNFATDLVSNNTTLYAKWSINIYTVNFDSQGGNAIASISATYNTTISTPTPPTKTGFTFVGWYKETACTNAWLFATDLVTVNMSLYAKWDLSNSVSSTSTQDFRLYPNPADDFVTLEGSNMKQASIFNLMGTMIIQLDIKGNDTTTINVGKLISGNYFIYVKTNDGKVVILKMLKL